MRTWLVKKRGNQSQYALAAKIGVPQSTYASIESGAREPSVTMAKKIAAAMGFDWTRFFEDENSAEGAADEICG